MGKTSLATVLAEYFGDTSEQTGLQSVVINCSTDDTFTSLWRNVFVGLGLDSNEDHFSPEYVRRCLEGLDAPALVVIDELDRLEDDDALTALADTIKTLSDHAVPSTLVLVGVARSIGELIGEHASMPYVILSGLSRGLITDEQLRTLQNRQGDQEAVPGEYETGAASRLF